MLDMLLFQEVLEYVSRTDRVLSCPGGSLLLAGRSGVGRRTVTSLVSHMHGAMLFSPKISRGYELKQFKNDIKHVSYSKSFALFGFTSQLVILEAFRENFTSLRCNIIFNFDDYFPRGY